MSATRTLTGLRLFAVATVLALVNALSAQGGAPEPGTRYHHLDQLGTTVGLSGHAGNVVARLATTAYGSPRISARGAAPAAARFTGKEWEPRTRLYDFGARYHDPAVGRFLSADAARQTFSPYPYVGAAPLERVDPDGNTYDAFAEEALKVAARELGHEDYRRIRDPDLMMEVAARARDYTSSRHFETAARLRRAEAELREARNARNQPLAAAGSSTLNGLRARVRLIKTMRAWTREKAIAVSRRGYDYDPNLLTEARDLALPAPGGIPHPAITARDMPEYHELLSAVEYARTGRQQ